MYKTFYPVELCNDLDDKSKRLSINYTLEGARTYVKVLIEHLKKEFGIRVLGTRKNSRWGDFTEYTEFETLPVEEFSLGWILNIEVNNFIYADDGKDGKVLLHMPEGNTVEFENEDKLSEMIGIVDSPDINELDWAKVLGEVGAEVKKVV